MSRGRRRTRSWANQRKRDQRESGLHEPARHSEYVAAMLAKKEVAKPPPHRDLREGRPDPADKRGLPCERCEQETPADDLTFLQGCWMCPTCRRRDDLIRAKAERMSEARQECEPF